MSKHSPRISRLPWTSIYTKRHHEVISVNASQSASTHALLFSFFRSKYPFSLTSHIRSTIPLVHCSTSAALAPPDSPRTSNTRSINSSRVILKAPEPGAEPDTCASTSFSLGRPYLRNRPHVVSGPLEMLDVLGGLSSRVGRSD